MGLQRMQSLRWRLMAAMLIVFGLGLGASALFSYGEAYGTLKELRKRTLQGQARELLAALERLAHAYESELRLTADAAHQLRTPITILDLRLQRARHEGRIEWPTIE